MSRLIFSLMKAQASNLAHITFNHQINVLRDKLVFYGIGNTTIVQTDKIKQPIFPRVNFFSI